jgi:hypothetical protein
MEVVRALWARRPEVTVHFRTVLPRWIFDFNLRGTFTLSACRLDVGAVQRDSLSLDAEATLRAYAALAARKDALIASEVAAVAPARPALIFADIPALAFDVAARLGVPGVAMTNFSWDWIYADYARDFAGYEAMVADLRTSYARATVLLRLPLHGDLSAFPHIADVPFVARSATLTRAAVCKRLGIGVALRRPPLVPRGVTFIVVQSAADDTVPPPPCRLVPTAELAAARVRHEDLVAAGDAVMTKPGYGIVAECIANATPIVYTPRGRFAEYACLVAGIEAHLPHAFISNEDLYAGRWTPALESVFAQPRRRPHVDVNGADVAADALLKLMDESACGRDG